MKTKYYLLFTFIFLLFLMHGFSPIVNSQSSWETDMVSKVNWVIDGDTFNVTSGYTVRLADINAPEYGESGYSNAKNYLISLAYNKTVYLDIDNVTGADPYGRLICVAFISYNSTHVTNVNKALLVNDYAVVSNFTNNEFNPSDWTLYVPLTAIPELPNILTLITLFTLASLPMIILKKKQFLPIYEK